MMDGQGDGIRYTGACMGVFGLKSWAPLREPGMPATAASVVNSVSQPMSTVHSVIIQPMSVTHSAMIRPMNAAPIQPQPVQSSATGGRMGAFGLESWAPPRELGTLATAASVVNSVSQPMSTGHSAMIQPMNAAPIQPQPVQSSATGACMGAFGLESWAPPRELGTLATAASVVNSVSQPMSTAHSAMIQPVNAAPIQPQPVQSLAHYSMRAEPLTNHAVSNSEKNSLPAPPARQRLVAKYAYDANVNSPLGQNAELDLCAADKMKMIATHPSQELWWLVEMDDGRRGYVPSTYVMAFDDKVTSLPWLANRPVEPLPPVSTQPYKPYKSAYDKDSSSMQAKPQYYCEVCQKQLNGPQPYNAHMNSKAHREEVELAAEFARA